MGNLSERPLTGVCATILLAALISNAGTVFAAGDSPANKKKPATKKTAAASQVQMTNAHVGEPYEFRFRGVKGVDVTDYKCDPLPALPKGLKLFCSELTVAGFPAGPTGTTTGTVTVHDSTGGKVTWSYTLQVLDHPDEAWIGAKPKGSATPVIAKPIVTPPLDSAAASPASASTPVGGSVATPTSPPGDIQPTLVVKIVSRIVDGASSISGTVTNARGETSAPAIGDGLKVELRMKGKDGSTYLAELIPGTATPPVYQTTVTNGSFVLNLKVPLAAGDNGSLGIVPSESSHLFKLSGALPRFELHTRSPRPKIEVTSLIRDGVKTIDGTYTPVPDPIASNATATPPVKGNLPSVVILLRNPGAPDDDWFRADLVTGTPQKTVSSLEALKDGTFEVQLKNGLAPGQSLKVALFPPEGISYDPGYDEKGHSPPEYAEWNSEEEGKPVYTSLAIAPPLITSEVAAGQDTIKGSATPSVANGTTVNIAAISDDSFQDYDEMGKSIARPIAFDGKGTIVSNDPLPACISQEAARNLSERFLPLTLTSGTGAYVPTDATTGNFTVKLATPLIEGQRFHLVELLPANTTLTPAEKGLCKTNVSTAKGSLDWGRIHADFVAGLLISNDSANSTTGSSTAGSGSFSQAHQFYALSIEKSWALPGCYLRVKSLNKDEAKPEADQCYDPDKHRLYTSHWTQHLSPGFSTYFQTRLTAIPVSTVASTNTTGSGTATSPTTSATPTSNLLSTAQTARVEVGAYFPFFITRWTFNERPYALFLAPLSKVGFDTVTGPSTVNTISPTGTAQSQTFEQVYTYWSYGARIGHAELTRSANRAPETLTYLDISFGPYSNLQSYICHGSDAKTSLPTTSFCLQPGHSPFVIQNGVDSRKRLYRFDIEGLLNVPRTPLYLGLNANIGQKTLGAAGLDQGFAAPNDVRFLFGTKFDIASVLMKFNLGSH